MLPAYMTYGVAPQRRAVSKKMAGALAYTHFAEIRKSAFQKNKNDPRKQFDPLMIPRVGFHEERANRTTPITREASPLAAHG